MKSLLISIILLSGSILIAQEAYIDGYGKTMIYDQVNHVKTDSLTGINTATPAYSMDNSSVYMVKLNTIPEPREIIYVDPTNHLIYDSMSVNVLTLTTVSDTTLIFGSNEVTNSIYVIDPINKTFDSVINVLPYRLAERPNAKEVWFVARNHFGVINYSNSSISVTNYPFAGSYGYYRDEIKFSPDGNYALMTNEFDGVTYKINATTKSIIDSNTNNGSIGLAFDATGDWYFQSKFNQHKIYKHQFTDMAIVDSFSTSEGARILYLSPNKLELYAIYHDQSKLEVFDISNYSTVALTTLAGNPYYIAFEKSGGPTNSLESTVLNEKFILYPNPSSKVVNVNCSVLGIINIYNSLGIKVKCLKTRKLETTIDILDLQHGTYFIEFISDNDAKRHTERLIIID